MSQELHQEFIYTAISLIAQNLQNTGDQLFNEVSTKQFRLMRELSQFDYPLSLIELANWLGTSRQNIKSQLTPLKAKNFVMFERSNSDKRSLQITLTSKGKRFVSQNLSSYSTYIHALFKDFSEAEVSQMSQLLQKLSNSIDTLDDFRDSQA